MVVIIDYNIGNVGSIKNMITKIGYACTVSRNLDVIENATKLILPGVGSFDNGMKNLHNFELFELLNRKVLIDKIPILGICLGMQLMAKNSDEGVETGLGWISAKVKKIEPNPSNDLTVPVIGWNYIKSVKDNPLLEGKNQRFYFVHSYYFPVDTEGCMATADIGFEYCAAFQVGNVFGVQFHPEKSHNFGKGLLTNFCNL